MWIIDKDRIFNPELDKAPRKGHKSGDYNPAREKELIHRFRLLDGDYNVYYEGRSTDCESDEAFAPLDDFGAPDAGCAEIQYLVNSNGCKYRRWVAL